jgi:hypothetical protein
MPDFSHSSKFNKEANFSSIRFGADAPLLETELNELQDIQNEIITSISKEVLPNGISNTSKVMFSNGTLTVNDCKFIVDGIIINVEEPLKIAVSNNDIIYLEVVEEVKTFQDTIKKLGNSQSSENVPNEIRDARLGFESSRRVQVTFNLVKHKSNPKAKYLEVGKLINNVFNITVLNYNNSFKFQDKDGKLYICFRQLSKEGKPQIIYKEVI